MKKSILLLIVIFTALNINSQESNYIFPYQDGIPKEQFEIRRKILMEKFSDKSLLVFLSANYFMNKSDISSKSLISPNQYYLSGIPPVRSVLILIPGGLYFDGKSINKMIFINTPNKGSIVWNGPGIDSQTIIEKLGIENVFELSQLDSMFNLILLNKDTVFVDRLSHTKHFSSADNTNECEIEIINQIRQKNEDINIIDRIPFIPTMRQIKDIYEIDLTQKAIDISILGHKSAIKNAKVGMMEYQLQALMEYEFLNGGSERPAYTCIIGTGINACYLHYINNNAECKDGDLVLMDCGAKYHGYCADITRTFPVSGKFTEEHKTLYNIVLEAQDSALTACKPGEQFSEIHKRAKAIIEKRLKELEILKGDDKVDLYFPHGTSHFLGLVVHDVSEKRILESGMILTVEPGIYIPAGSECDKKWWNIGIRIEDNILITDNGYKNLSEKMPKSIEEIEKLMSK